MRWVRGACSGPTRPTGWDKLSCAAPDSTIATRDKPMTRFSQSFSAELIAQSRFRASTVNGAVLLIQSEHQQRMPRWDHHVLLAFAHISDRIGVDIAAGLESPQQAALFCVKRKEGAPV